MSAYITLVSAISITKEGTTRLEITAEGINVTSKIFAIQVLPGSADPANNEFRFSHVCSPMELYEFPEDSVTDGEYFRTESISMVFDTAEQANCVCNTIRYKVEHLVNELNSLEEVGASLGSLAVPDVISILSAPPEFQFSVDGEEWHDEQTDTDVYIRMRNSALKADWSEKVKMPVRQ